MVSVWIDKTFAKRECVRFVASLESQERCACGQNRMWHRLPVKARDQHSTGSWNVVLDTRTYSTDSYGSIDFEGAASPDIVKFLRLDYASSPRDIVQLLVHKWHFEVPHLVVSIHGAALGPGRSRGGEFHLEPRLKKALRKGLRKIVATPGCWVLIEDPIDSILHLVKDAMIKKQTAHVRAGNVICIGHWGSFPERQQLSSKGVHVKYSHSHSLAGKGLAFSCGHKCLLLADNGTTTNSGCVTNLRRKLECYLSEGVGDSGLHSGVPVICLIIGGGIDTVQTAADYVTSVPVVPVVVCSGTGGSADLLALACRLATDKGELSESQALLLLSEVNGHIIPFDKDVAAAVFNTMCKCLRNKSLVSTFSFSNAPDQTTEKCLDSVVLAALLHGCAKSSFQEQLALTIYWSRPDLANHHIFRSDRKICVDALHDAMLHALVHDKADFVTLLLDKGVNMKQFLTHSRLEELYNAAPVNVGSRYILDMLLKTERAAQRHRIHLSDIGQIINRLMGFGYRSSYKKYRSGGMAKRQLQTPSAQPKVKQLQLLSDEKDLIHFELPHNELMIWAILTDRKKLPKLMWQREQEVLAKAVVAGKLYTALANELESSSQIDRLIMEDYRHRAKKFETRAVDTLNMCYQHNRAKARSLLSCHLSNWSDQNVLSLAHSANMREFVAHPCCQDVITEIWLGGLTINKQASLSVLCGIILPPTICALCFNEQLSRTNNSIGLTGFSNEAFDASTLEGQAEYNAKRMSLAGEEPVQLGVSRSEKPEDHAWPRTSLGRNPTILKRISTFYSAPITKFWMHSIAFCVFLMMLSYTALVRMTGKPRWAELYCIVYIFFLVLEMVREVSNYKYISLTKRLRAFFDDKWNIIDTTGCILFLTGLVLRFQGDELLLLVAKAIYSVAVMIWVVRLLENLSVNRTIGYFTIVMWNMLSILFKFCILAVIFIFAFGVPKQAIRFPKQDFSWDLLKNVTMKPYFMLFGELFKLEIDGTCTNSSDIDSCLPGFWLHPLLQAVYQIIGMGAVVNVFFTWINQDYQDVAPVVDKIWMYERYNLVVGYSDKLVLPPPLTPVSYLYLLANQLTSHCKEHRAQDNTLRDKQLDSLRSFEEQCFLEGMQEKDNLEHASMKKKVKKTHERMCTLDLKLSRKLTATGLQKKENTLVSMLPDVRDVESSLEHMLGAAQNMEKHLTVLEALAHQRLELVCQLSDTVLANQPSSFPLAVLGPVPSSLVQVLDAQRLIADLATDNAMEAQQNQAPTGRTGRMIGQDAIYGDDLLPSEGTDGGGTLASCLVIRASESSRESLPIQLAIGSTTNQVIDAIGPHGSDAGNHASNETVVRNVTMVAVSAMADSMTSATMPSDGLMPIETSECSIASDTGTTDAADARAAAHVAAADRDGADPDEGNSAGARNLVQMLGDDKPCSLQPSLSSLPDDHFYTDLAADDDKVLLLYDDACLDSVSYGQGTTRDLNVEPGDTLDISPDIRLPMTALVCQQAEGQHAARPSWLPLDAVLPDAQPAATEQNSNTKVMPCLPDIDIRVEDMSGDVNEDDLLRSIEENAALIIGKRLQGKMVTFAGHPDLDADRSPAEWILADSAPSPRPQAGKESVTTKEPTSDDFAGGCMVAERAAAELSTTGGALPYGPDTSVEPSKMRSPNIPVYVGGSVSASARRSSLQVPKFYQGRLLTKPMDDMTIMIRSTSEHSINSAAGSEISAYTETSFLTDV